MPRIMNPNNSLADSMRLRNAKRMPQALNARLPFVAVDGEGGGTDTLGRQRYLLLRAGDDYILNNDGLSTDDCLGFLSGLPTDKIYVAYYFDYDVTMILRDATPNQRTRLLRPIAFGIKDERRSTYVGNYDVEYMPRKYFKVRHVSSKKWVQINEVGPFFQCSFVKAITDWQCGTEDQRKLIAHNKARRTQFETMTDEELIYNELECRLLTELMDKFRSVCSDTGYIPSRWQGPGYLATDMLKKHGIHKSKEFALDPELASFANAAYYGGRFELFKIGQVQNVYEADINSAYPFAMQHLPCLEHGNWHRGTGKPPEGALYVADVSFSHPHALAICNLPIRDKKTGSICWPIHGKGRYWSIELDAACSEDHIVTSAGACSKTIVTEWREHWHYERKCNCRPFDFINEVYAIRKSIGKGTKGYALKLAINSLYGKTAQSIGSAPYANPIWAGLITAYTRAMLIRAYSTIDSRSVVMLATDGIYTTEALDLSNGSELGQWETKLHEEMFLVQPGIYFSSASKARPKTRGVSLAVVLEHEEKFRSVFADWLSRGQDICAFAAKTGVFPSVTMPLHVFIGMKLAQAWGKPDLAGRWENTTKTISFDFSSKREYGAYCDGHISTLPRLQGSDIVSAPYNKEIGSWKREAQIEAAMAISQPDLFSISPSDRM